MKILKIESVTHVRIDTDIGDFRVWKNGAVDQWKFDDENGSDWDLCDESDFEDGVIKTIRDAGLTFKGEAK